MRQLPTLPRRLQRSTLGLRTLNCCVRNGNRWNRPGIITALMSVVHSKLDRRNSLQIGCEIPFDQGKRCALSINKSSPRPISTGQLHALPHFYAQPIYLVFCKGSYSLIEMRYFISGRASRLDAFSVYPFRTQLPSHALGRTTGTPLVRPLRSSRTRSSLPHVSFARDGYGPNCLTTF